MNDHADLEARLRTALRERAAATPIAEPQPGMRPLALTAAPRRWMAAAVVAGVAVMIVGVLALRSSDTSRVRTDGPAAAGVGADGRGVLPTYDLDLEGVSRTITEGGGDAPSGPSQDPTRDMHVQSFRSPARGFDGPLIWVRDVRWAGPPDPDIGFGFGEDSPVARETEVRGYVAYVSTYAGTVTVGVPVPQPRSNEGLYVTGRGMTEDELVAFVDGLVARPSGIRGFDVTVPIDDLVQVWEGPDSWVGLRNQTTEFTDADGVTYNLWIGEADESTFEAMVSDRTNSAATVASASVGDHAAVLVRYSGDTDDHTLMWRPTPGTIAELRAVAPADRMREVAAALRPVDEAAWVQLPGPPVRESPAVSTTTMPP